MLPQEQIPTAACKLYMGFILQDYTVSNRLFRLSELPELLPDISIHVQWKQYQELLLRYGYPSCLVQGKYSPVLLFFRRKGRIQDLRELQLPQVFLRNFSINFYHFISKGRFLTVLPCRISALYGIFASRNSCQIADFIRKRIACCANRASYTELATNPSSSSFMIPIFVEVSTSPSMLPLIFWIPTGSPSDKKEFWICL